MTGSTAQTLTANPETRRFSASDALTEAGRALPQMWRGAGPVLLLTAVLFIASRALPGPAEGALLGISWLTGLCAFGARTRIGVLGLNGARAEGLGWGGFQFRRLEARLLGATLLIGLFMTIILSIVALAALALFGAAGLNAQAITEGDWARVGPAWKLALLTVIGLLLLALPTIMAVRISLYAQATLAWGRMTSLAATGVTNGAMLGLLLGLLACAAPTLVWLAVATTAGIGGVPAWAGLALVTTMIQAPLSAGFLGRAWQALGRPAP